MNSEVKVISTILIITALVIVGGLSLVSKVQQISHLLLLILLLISTSSPMAGKETAKVHIVEFGDFACPACAMLQPHLDQVLTTHSDDVKVSLRLIPIHNSESYNSAIAAFAAKNQGKFFEYGHTLFIEQEKWFNKPNQRDIFIQYAKNLNLDITKFTQDIDSADFQKTV